MATLNEVIRVRRVVIKNLRNRLKAVDSNLEISERLLKRIASRKRNVPTQVDLATLSKQLVAIADALGNYENVLKQGFPA